MGLFNRIKNLLVDEEIVEETKEIEVEGKIEPPKLPTVMRDDIEKKEKEESISDSNLVKTSTKFNFPIEFSEEEFMTTRKMPERVSRNVIELEKNKEKEPYMNKKEEAKKFVGTPIISPIYGILDKNYKKEEVMEKDESEYEIPRPSRKVDFESVRQKAYGSLTDDLKSNILCEDCEYLKEAKSTRTNHVDYDSLLREMIETKNEDTLESAEENYEDFGIAYEKKEEPIADVKELKVDVDIDVEVEIEHDDDTITKQVKITNHNEEEPIAEKIEVKEEKPKKKIDKKVVEKAEEKEINKEETSLELTDDLFNLIDAMYEDKEE